MGWLSGLAGLASGGVISALGDVLGGKMMEGIGGLIGGSSSQPFGATDYTQTMRDTMEMISGRTPDALRNAATNQMGQTGAAAGQGAQLALGQHGNSATALRDANAMRMAAEQGVGKSLENQALGQEAIERQNRSLNKSMQGLSGLQLLTAKQQGQEAMGSSLIQNLLSSNQAYQAAQGAVGAAAGQAQGVLQNDLNNRFAQRVQPYLTSYDPQAMGLLGMATQGAQGAASSSYDRADRTTNSLAGLAYGLGDVGKGWLDQYQERKFANTDAGNTIT